MTAIQEKIDALSRALETLKNETYECPGPTRDVDESVKDAIERFLENSAEMRYTDCIALHCCACERFDDQDEKVAETEDQLDILFERSETESATASS